MNGFGGPKTVAWSLCMMLPQETTGLRLQPGVKACPVIFPMSSLYSSTLITQAANSPAAPARMMTQANARPAPTAPTVRPPPSSGAVAVWWAGAVVVMASVVPSSAGGPSCFIVPQRPSGQLSFARTSVTTRSSGTGCCSPLTRSLTWTTPSAMSRSPSTSAMRAPERLADFMAFFMPLPP